MIKISIVLPTYNVEQYLGECIESCLHQDLLPSEYEIIIVIDGATDNSLAIAQQYAQTHSNIVIIEQENRGLSGARNTGLYAAKGYYIWFVDSDDYIKNNCLKQITNKMDINQLDAIFVNRCIVSEIGKLVKPVFLNKELGVVNGITFFHKKPEGYYLAWRYIFRRPFLIEHNLRYYEGILHEDVEFNHRMLYYLTRIELFNECLYYYRIREGSIMTSSKKKERLRSMRVIMSNLSCFRDKIVSDYKYKIELNSSIVQLCSMYLYNISAWDMILSGEIRPFKQLNVMKVYYRSAIFEKIKIILIKYLPVIYSIGIVHYNKIKTCMNQIHK